MPLDQDNLERLGALFPFYTAIFNIHSIQVAASLPIPNNLMNIEIDGRLLHYVEQGDGQLKIMPKLP
jgi:hypothetical protein